MKKKLFAALAAAVMSVAMSLTAFAAVDAAALAEENAKTAKVLEKGQWVTEGNYRKYVYDDGTFAQDVWKGIDGYVYHFDGNGYMEASKLVKAGGSMALLIISMNWGSLRGQQQCRTDQSVHLPLRSAGRRIRSSVPFKGYAGGVRPGICSGG